MGFSKEVGPDPLLHRCGIAGAHKDDGEKR